MGFRTGIVGLPNVGKSTVFNALTRAHAAVSNYPFCTIDPNVGIVPVPDPRLDRLGEIYQPDKLTPTTLQFVDIAGLVKGSSEGHGLGNQFLGHIREVDAILHVVRLFEDPNIAHVSGGVDPVRDMEVIDMELGLKDLESIEKRIDKTEKLAHAGDKLAKEHLAVYQKVRQALSEAKPVRKLALQEEEKEVLKDLMLLTAKPVLYCCNVSEKDLPDGGPLVDVVRQIAVKEGAKVTVISAEVEAELAELEVNEREEFFKELGLKESGLNQLIRIGYELLGLITFFTTVGKQEVRAWTVQKGTKAPQAAGVVHTDFERGFIRAEVMRYEDLAQLGSEKAVREKGHLRVEGKDYVVQDGDVICFRFHV